MLRRHVCVLAKIIESVRVVLLILSLTPEGYMYTQTNIVSKVIKHVAKPTAFVAAFLLLIQPVEPLFAVDLPENPVIVDGTGLDSSTTKKDLKESITTGEITKEEAKNFIQENQREVSVSPLETPVPSLFKKDESKSVQEELVRVKKHIEENNLPVVALERLNEYEGKLMQANQSDGGIVENAQEYFKSKQLNRLQVRREERLIDAEPFKVDGLNEEIRTQDVRNYERDYKNGMEKLRWLENVKQLIDTKKFFEKKNQEDKTFLPNILKTQEVGAAGDDPADYLAQGGEIIFSQAIQAKADELGNDTLHILNFVRNEIDYSPYYGSKKGADATLAESKGNDTDKSSLLIAMLRASDIPARYRHVDMKASIGTVTNLLGVNDPIRAAEILSLQNIPYTLYTLAGEPYFFVIDHTYVEAYVPYGYSRGADMNDQGANQWVPMEPTLNSYFYSQRVDIVAEMVEDGFDVQSFYDDYLNGEFDTLEPMEAFGSEVEAYLAGSPIEYYPGLSYEESQIKTYNSEKVLDFIPGSLPFEISATIGTYDYIPASLRHMVELTITDNGSDILSHGAYLSDFADQEVLISYDAATPEDQSILDTFETMYDVVPLSLIEVTPKIKVQGDIVATATASNILGSEQDYTIEFIAPEREMGGLVESEIVKTIEKGLTSGVTEAFAFNTDRVVPSIVRESEDAESTSFAEDQKLYRTAVDYLYRLQTTHEELADITGGDFVHYATSTSISNGVTVTYSDDMPFSFEWTGLRINAYASVRYFSRLGDEINHNREEFISVFGLQASQDESDIFEDNFDVEAVATVKGMKLVSDGLFPGITLEKITEANEGDIDTLDISEGTKGVFHDAVDEGKIIYTPSAPITYGDWNGLFYIAVDFEGGDATYAIGEGLNGGYTIEEFPEGLVHFWRESILNLTAVILSPYSGQDFDKGDTIEWSANYNWALGNFVENLDLDTSDYPVGNVILYSGYGTDDSVVVEIEQDPVTLIGDAYHEYDDLIIEYEDEFGIPRGLLKSIIHKETASSPFEPDQYRYEPKVDYDNFSGPSADFPITITHPYNRFAIAGHMTTGAFVSEGAQLDDLDPAFTDVIKSRGTGGWALRSIKGYLEGQTYGQLLANDTSPGSQGWPSVPDSDFTAQVVISASYGMGHVLYFSAMTLAEDMDGDIWFDTSAGGTARSAFDMNEPDTAIRLAASVLRKKYNVVTPIAGDAEDCDGWGHAVRGYNGASSYRDDVCANFYETKYKP